MKRHVLYAAMSFILAIGLSSGITSAQKTITIQNWIPAIFYVGLETSKGVTDTVSGITYGNTFALSSTGEWDARYLTISINGPAASEELGEQGNITGGTWSLVIFNEGVYAGTLYGEILSGDTQNITDETGRLVQKRSRISLRSIGGTGIYDKKIYENIPDVLDITTDLDSAKTNGFGFLNF